MDTIIFLTGLVCFISGAAFMHFLRKLLEKPQPQ
jgi:hypothetical protein